MKIKFLAVLMVVAALGGLTSCGVRGRPQAPLTPAELGRGEPGFKRASEEFAFPNVPTPTPAATPRVRPADSATGETR